MNLEEFNKRLMIEPNDQDPEFLAARRASTEHMAAARDAEAFESLLGDALRPAVDPELHEQILSHSLGADRAPGGRAWQWMAIAATLVLAFGLSSVFFYRPAEALPLREAFVEHLRYPEPKALTSLDQVSENDVKKMFARYGADLVTEVGQVTYLSPCKIGGKRGIHMVVTESDGRKITVMYLPRETLAMAEEFSIDEISARMVRTPIGVLALFGHQGQDVNELSTRLMRGLGGLSIAALSS
jgi:hypothetical protein